MPQVENANSGFLRGRRSSQQLVLDPLDREAISSALEEALGAEDLGPARDFLANVGAASILKLHATDLRHLAERLGSTETDRSALHALVMDWMMQDSKNAAPQSLTGPSGGSQDSSELSRKLDVIMERLHEVEQKSPPTTSSARGEVASMMEAASAGLNQLGLSREGGNRVDFQFGHHLAWLN